MIKKELEDKQQNLKEIIIGKKEFNEIIHLINEQ